MQNNEGAIRRAMIEADVVDCMVALPPQLFFNTQIPACIWFLTKNKQERGTNGGKRRNRKGEFLFIDARNKGHMKDRVLRDFSFTLRKLLGSFLHFPCSSRVFFQLSVQFSQQLLKIGLHAWHHGARMR